MAKINSRLRPTHFDEIVSPSTKEGTPSFLFYDDDWYNNTGSDRSIGFLQGYKSSKVSYNNDRQFIKLLECFKRQLQKLVKPDSYDEEGWIYKMKKSANFLLKYVPNKISLELIEESVIYYTAILDNSRIYLSHYLNSEEEDIDEFVVSIFSNNSNIINSNGALEDITPLIDKNIKEISSL